MNALLPTLAFILLMALIYIFVISERGLFARILRRRERHRSDIRQAGSGFSEARHEPDAGEDGARP